MTDGPIPEPSEPDVASPVSTWQRLRERKVVQWTLAYIALAYGLLHGVEMIGHAFEWPTLIARVVTLLLAVGVPVAALLAWYHGDRGQQRVSGTELTILTVLFFIAGTVLWALVRKADEHASPTTPQQTVSSQPSGDGRATPPAAAPRASIAVVPFANLTGEPAKEYFSDGMAEELINTLAGVPGLKVPARTSSFAYKGRNIDVRQIAHDLGVGAVLEGSVRSAGERIRVTVQLVDGKTGYHMWSQSYNRKFTDLFKLQEDLATAIVQALRQQMHAELPSTLSQPPPTQDLEAYDLYQQARSLIGRSGSAEDLRAARELLQAATVRDPRFARAFSSIGLTHAISFSAGFSSDPQELVKAEEAAQDALSLDPDLVESRVVLAQVDRLRGNWLAARPVLEAALSTNGADSEFYPPYAILLLNVGHVRQLLQETREADRLAPGSARTAIYIAMASSVLGLDTEAVRYAKKAVNLGASPDSLAMPAIYGRAAQSRGDTNEARAQWAKVLPPEVRQSGGAEAVNLIYAALGDPSKKTAAISALRDLRANAPGMDSSRMVVLLINWYTMLGALDLAYEVGNKGLDGLQRSGVIGAYWTGLWISEMRPFRQDPRFQAFVHRLGMMDYWKKYGPPDDCELSDGKLVCH